MLGFQFSWTKCILAFMGIVSFLVASFQTPLKDFFLWLPFGWSWFAPLYLFIIDYYPYMLSALFPLLFLQKKPKTFYILVVLGVLFFLFLTFFWL